MKKLVAHKNMQRGNHTDTSGCTPGYTQDPANQFLHSSTLTSQNDQLEVATNNMVLGYEKYHPSTPNPRLQAQWETQRGQDVGRYREVLKQMLEAENQRLEAFSGEHYDDLHLTNAFARLPLYQVFQRASANVRGGAGDGPYRF